MLTVPASLIISNLLHLYCNTVLTAGQFRSFYSCAFIRFLFVAWALKFILKGWTYPRDTQSQQNFDFSLKFKTNTQDKLNGFIIITITIFFKGRTRDFGGTNCLVFTATANVTRAQTVPGAVTQQLRKISVARGFNSVIRFNLIQICWVHMLHLLSHWL